MSSFFGQINNLYQKEIKKTYWQKYQGDLFISVIIIIIFIVILGYFNVLNAVQPLRRDWASQRCKPSVIPFAGFINKPADQSFMEFTADNFTGCVQAIIKESLEYLLIPFYYILYMIQIIYIALSSALNAFRELFLNLRLTNFDIINNIYQRLLNISVPIYGYFNTASTVINTTQATSMASMYTVFGGFTLLQSVINLVYERLVLILWALAAYITFLLALSWGLPGFLLVALVYISIMAAGTVPTLMTAKVIGAMGYDAATLPMVASVPSRSRRSCFIGNVEIETNEGLKRIDKIKIGEILKDKSKVTCVMKCKHINDLYELNGVLVTEYHKVFVKNKGWVNVKDHENSIKVFYKPKYVYCLSTDTKIIKIKDLIFSDWDEVDDEDIDEIKNNKDSPFSNLDTRYQISESLETGLDKNTNLKLKTGEIIRLKEIEIGDELECGAKILGIVQIASNKKHKYKSIYKDDIKLITCLENTEIINLGNIKISYKKEEIPKYYCHLITDKDYFLHNGLKITNYGRGVDRFLSFKNLNNPLN